MSGGKTLLAVYFAVMAMPVFAVESFYLDTVEVANPGEYLTAENFYMHVPLPFIPSAVAFATSLAPATIYDQGLVITTSTTYFGAAPSRISTDDERVADAGEVELRVWLKAGLDNASDVPLAAMREHFAEGDVIQLVDDGDEYDVTVEVETMKMEANGTVIVVVNAYRDVSGESLIFYNNFGYLGAQKLLSGSTSYAEKLESALLAEAERIRE